MLKTTLNFHDCVLIADFSCSQPNNNRNCPKELQKENSIFFKTTNNRHFNMSSTEVAKDERSGISEKTFHCSASSVDSIPSASGSSE